ncbi:MAG TPA: AAA family ATPase [Tepidisphaeraceae bacterium]|jgi:chromosome segregation protein|nr:AAA family ATPase [Tepidisphaeraceae bacterium]
MRLKKLILHGFKSFADRTEFVFDSPITGIVGPNGCGKSNVVDGFKWVLGEQSAKSLRGDAMMDVIFNGSAARKPSGMSEVVLVFENPKRIDDTRLLNLDTDEVTVGRRLFRDGTSEYQLNNQITRLKDIRELFFDTGIGVDAYSVIEQGRVAALLESNPQERRLIFEEAAGISKFKAKKKEAQRKLERVDQNLLRVTDIVEEVEKRLRSVRIQAGRARMYQEHSQRLRELRLTYALQEYHTHHLQLEEQVSQQGVAQGQLEQLATDLSEKQIGLAQMRDELEKRSQRRQNGEYELVQTKAALQSSQQRQQYARQQLQQIAEQLTQFEQDRLALCVKSDEVDAALASEQSSLDHFAEELSNHRRQIEEQQQTFSDTQIQLNQINREIEQHKTAILDLMRRSAAVNNRLGAIDIERKNISAQQSRLGERRRVVLSELETLESARTELDQNLQSVVAELADLQGKLAESAKEAAALGRQIAQIAEQLGSAREHRSALLSRQRLLQDLEAKREGFTEGVKSILRQRADKFPFIRGVVADVLRVDVEHAHVIEAALDGRDQMLICDDSAALASIDLSNLEGRVNFLSPGDLALPPIANRKSQIANPLNLPQTIEDDAALPFGPMDKRLIRQLLTDVAAKYDWNQHPQRIRFAVDLVRFEPIDAPIAHHLLGRTIVVDNLDDALALHKNGLAGFRYVTRKGEVLEADGTLRAGPLTAAMGLISRRSELEALALQISDADRRIAELSAQLNTGNEQARALEQKQNELRNATYQFNTRKVELTGKLAQNSDKQTAFRREVPILERELQNFLDQIGRLKTEEMNLFEQRSALDTEQSARQQAVEQLTTRQADGAQSLKDLGESLTTLRVQLGQVQEKHIASQQSVARLTSARTELAEQLQRVERSAQQLTSRRSSVEKELESAEEAEKQLENQLEKLSRQIELMTQQVTEATQIVEKLSSDLNSVSREHDRLQQSLHQLEIKIGEIRVRLEGLVQRTLDELQLNLPEKYQELEQQGGYQPNDTDWDAIAEEIKVLKEKIHRLGNVNLDAIGEQDELEQRQTFLSTQVNDLTQSKQQLEQLIDTINTESSLRFEQTFNAVREHFQGMFRKLFGGGKADIFLETNIDDTADQQPILAPDGTNILPILKKTIDPLDAGIEIMAHPPGKKPVSISQLSGGEKTMTCVALLMSIFKSKPSPFCILDEVDAALDEANNQRFNLIVQEFLEQSQFIIITHSKRTMQIADVLYGVTMQEQGVSKRVSVKFDQVDSHGQIAETAAA